MKRTIELYIDGVRADLDTNGLILMNYALTDLEKPSAVKNSYSKQITLPGTPTNASIFGHIFRVDRRNASGFNAGQKTPFEVFNEMQEKVLTGYIRLDSVTRKGNIVTGYKVSLFGGLGGFFYSLSYDVYGNKRTLADLDYLGEGDSEELDFVINKDVVLAAWSRLSSHTPGTIAQKWDVINFAPAYNGTPDGDFSADKGVGAATDLGLDATKTDGGKTYNANGGKVLVNLASAKDEWAMKDLRSYLQRPVLNMWAFMQAIANPDNNGGYEVDLSHLPGGWFYEIYKTLPMIPSLGSAKEESGSYSLSFGETATYSGDVLSGGATINQEVSASTKINAKIKLSTRFRFGSSGHSGETIYPAAYYSERAPGGGSVSYRHDKKVVIFTQLLAYNGTTLIGGSTIHCFTAYDGVCSGYNTPEAVAGLVGFVPKYAAGGYEAAFNEISNDGISISNSQHSPYGDWASLDIVEYEIEAYGVNRYRLAVASYVVEYTQSVRQGRWQDPVINSITGSGDILAVFFTTSSLTTASTLTADGAAHGRPREWYTLTYTSTSQLRSGAYITKQNLLSSQYTPAEYLIAYCKQFGWLFLCEKDRKKITILPRNDWYGTGAAVIDLTKRIDRGQDITIKPLAMASKWYELNNPMAEGAFAQEYKSIYGVDFGVQRVNTGYDFDAKAVALLENSTFRQAVTILDHGRYWNMAMVGGAIRPSVFLDKGNTYTLWGSTDGAGKNFDIPTLPNTTTYSYYNEHGHNGYDKEFMPKLELRDKDNKSVDGVDILVIYSGTEAYEYFKVSDDTALMMAINDNVPCWDMTPGTSQGIDVPAFSKYADYFETWRVDFSLDFGMPRELDIPYITFNENKGSMYLRYWKQYLADQLDANTKVLKCKVDLSGLEVGPDLLRRFFYYEGCIWALNKISNYSMTTWDPAECEFVQVQDMDNYINGQDLT
jgi:hypothetical protein